MWLQKEAKENIEDLETVFAVAESLAGHPSKVATADKNMQNMFWKSTKQTDLVETKKNKHFSSSHYLSLRPIKVIAKYNHLKQNDRYMSEQSILISLIVRKVEEGKDLDLRRRWDKGYENCSLSRIPHRRLSAPCKVFNFSFNGLSKIRGRDNLLKLKAEQEGTLNAIVFWFDLHMDSDTTITTGQSSYNQSHLVDLETAKTYLPNRTRQVQEDKGQSIVLIKAEIFLQFLKIFLCMHLGVCLVSWRLCYSISIEGLQVWDYFRTSLKRCTPNLLLWSMRQWRSWTDRKTLRKVCSDTNVKLSQVDL